MEATPPGLLKILAVPEGRARLGSILTIPERAEVEMCGAGFNERTVRICWQGKYYFAFQEDVVAQCGGTEKRKTASSGA